MTWIRNKFLLYPLLAFLGVFALDKLFFLDAVREHTVHWQKVEPVFYASREHLFEQLKSRVPEYRAQGERLGLIFGSSRSAEFSNEDLQSLIPNSQTYNFSAPFSCPVFHYYWLERTLNAGIQPDFIILEIDPILLADNSLEYTLQYALDVEFVAQNTDLFRNRVRDPWNYEGKGFSYDQAETYFANAFFGLRRFPFRVRAIIDNNKDINLLAWNTAREYRNYVIKMVEKANESKLGGIPNLLLVQKTPLEMIADAETNAQRYFPDYQPSPTQIVFFKKILRAAAERDIPVVVYWPVSTDIYAEKMREYKLDERVFDPMTDVVANIAAEHDGAWLRVVDPMSDPRFQCRAFIDSYHLSGACFPKLSELIVERLPENLTRGGKAPEAKPTKTIADMPVL